MITEQVASLLNLLKRFDCFDSSVKDGQLWFSGNIDGKPLTLTINTDGARELLNKEFAGSADKSGVEMGKVNMVDELPYVKLEWTQEEIENFRKLTSQPPAPPGNDKLISELDEMATAAAEYMAIPNVRHRDHLLGCIRKAKTGTNFPRSSQNQTVSGGVEGAHEGTTADEKGGEPEKLNNAQGVAESSTIAPLLREALSRVTFLRSCILCNEVLSHEEAVDLKEWIDKIKLALAESSLSHTSDSSAPTSPAPLSTQLDTAKEKV